MTVETTTAFDEQRTACPSTGDMHRYFIFKTEVVFEPWAPVMSDLEKALLPDMPALLFVKKEYAILGCNCGSVIKKVVKQ